MRNQPPAHELTAPRLATHDGQDSLGRGYVVRRVEYQPVALEPEPLRKLSQVRYQTISTTHLVSIMNLSPFLTQPLGTGTNVSASGGMAAWLRQTVLPAHRLSNRRVRPRVKTGSA